MHELVNYTKTSTDLSFQILQMYISLEFISFNQNNNYLTNLSLRIRLMQKLSYDSLHLATEVAELKRSRSSSGSRNIQSNLYSLKRKLNDDDNVDDGYLSARVSSFVLRIFCIFLYPHIIDPFITQEYRIQYFDVMNTVCNSLYQYKIIYFSKWRIVDAFEFVYPHFLFFVYWATLWYVQGFIMMVDTIITLIRCQQILKYAK